MNKILEYHKIRLKFKSMQVSVSWTKLLAPLLYLAGECWGNGNVERDNGLRWCAFSKASAG